jgi:hypothetical protein
VKLFLYSSLSSPSLGSTEVSSSASEMDTLFKTKCLSSSFPVTPSMETQEKQSGFKQACVSSKSSGKYSDIDLRQNFKDFSHLTVQSSSDASKSNRVNAGKI